MNVQEAYAAAIDAGIEFRINENGKLAFRGAISDALRTEIRQSRDLLASMLSCHKHDTVMERVPLSPKILRCPDCADDLREKAKAFQADIDIGRIPGPSPEMKGFIDIILRSREGPSGQCPDCGVVTIRWDSRARDSEELARRVASIPRCESCHEAAKAASVVRYLRACDHDWEKTERRAWRQCSRCSYWQKSRRLRGAK